MFPTGAAGIALFALRFSVAITLVVNETLTSAVAIPIWAVPVLCLLGLFLCLGLLTPYCALLNCLVGLATFPFAGTHNGFHFGLSIVDSAILAVLGPGAYSADARLFGRRILTVPRRG